jgi:hypothetical protein
LSSSSRIENDDRGSGTDEALQQISEKPENNAVIMKPGSDGENSLKDQYVRATRTRLISMFFDRDVYDPSIVAAAIMTDYLVLRRLPFKGIGVNHITATEARRYSVKAQSNHRRGRPQRSERRVGIPDRSGSKSNRPF